MRKLILIALTLFALVAALSPTPTRAQDDPSTTWYWATTPEGLVAYTADGDVNLIFQEGVFLNVSLSGYRFANDSALLQKGEDFFWATSDSAQKFPIELNAAIHDLHPIDFNLPYLLMGSPQSSVTSIVLDIENFQAIPLSGNALIPRFLPDGQTLRYVTYQRENEQIVGTTLWEINLATGHQTVLHQHEGRPNTMYSSPNGSQWWFVYNFRLGDPSGAEVMTIGEPSSRYTQWIADNTAYIVDEWLFHDLPCPSQCATEVYLLTEEPNLRYQLSNSHYVPRSIYHFADDSLWLSGPSGVRLVDSGGKVFDLGQTAWGVRGPLFSNDGRWAISISHSVGYVEFPRTLYIWYLPHRAIMFELQLEWSAEVQFFGTTVLVIVDNRGYLKGSAFVAWRNYDSPTGASSIALPDLLGTFFQPVANGNVLYFEAQSGIYLYAAAQNSLTELVPQGQPIIIQELE